MSRLGVAAALAIAILGMVAVESGLAGSSPLPRIQVTPTPGQLQFALLRLGKLTVRPDGAATPYKRTKFGTAWRDQDGNSCDTRDDILRRDMTTFTFKSGSTCTIATGVLQDPYTGTTIAFDKATAPQRIQIDHMVALGDAWRTGASTWTDDERLTYANDPQVLLAVDGPANQAKGDDDAAHWLPPNQAYWCMYVIRQITIKSIYDLSVNSTEKANMASILDSCQTTPTGK
jgi:hypothetical protein